MSEPGLELDKALDCLCDEFNVGRAGPSGLRAQAIAHVRQARLLLQHATERVVCGTHHPNRDTNRRCNVLAGIPPEDADSYDDTGCGQPMVWTYSYRCLDCGRFFHAACLRRHFSANAEPPY